MSFKFKLSPKLEKKLDKLAVRDRNLAIAVRKKINQIINFDYATIDHFKNLRHDLKHLKRVQIGSFVLAFQVKGDIIVFEILKHHDRAYKR